jgi:hypothetical protein
MPLPRTCGLAVSGLAIVGAWAALQLVINYCDVTGSEALWAIVFYSSFALPTMGAGMSVFALFRIEDSGGRLGGRFLATAALGLAAAVGASGTINGSVMTMLGFAVSAVVSVIVYVAHRV